MYLAILFFMLVGAINLPFVHRGITKKANNIFHEKGLPLHIGKVTLLLSGKIAVKQAEIITEENDTIVYAGEVNIAFRPIPLLFKRIVVKDLTIHNAVVNLLTDSITGKLTLLTYLPVSGKSDTKNKKEGKPWDIDADAIHLRDIRFLYSAPLNGMLIQQNLFKADLLIDNFSLLHKSISVNFLKLEKVNGKIELNTKEKNEKKEIITPAPFAWKISLSNLQLLEILISFNQHSGLHNTEIVSSLGKITGKNLDLVSNKIVISKLKMENPDIILKTSGKSSDDKKAQKKIDSTSSKAPWAIELSAFNIKNGAFGMNKEQSDSSDFLSKLLPVSNFNTTIRDFLFTPGVTGFEINRISLTLNDKNVLQSGKISFHKDSLQALKMSLRLAATLNNKNISRLSRNDTIQVSADLSGSMDSLQIEKFKIHTPSGIDLFLSGRIIEPLKIPYSGCMLNLRTGSITSKQVAEMIGLFGKSPELPAFKPVTLSAYIRGYVLLPEFELKLKSLSGNMTLAGNLDLKNKTGNLKSVIDQLKPGELTGLDDLEKISGSLTLTAGWKNAKELTGEGTIEIDTILYKNVVSRNINFSLSVNKNECLFNINAADSSLMCGLKGLFSWQNNSYHGNISGNFNIDEGRLHLVPFPLRTKGELSAHLDKSSDSFESSLDLINFIVTKGGQSETIKSTTLELTMADSLVKALFKTDFMTTSFQSNASFSDLKKAVQYGLSTTILSKDTTEFFNLDALLMVPDMNLEMTVQYNPLFGLFVPDTVLNFSSLKVLMAKKSMDSLMLAELSAKSIKFKSFYGFGAFININGEPGGLSWNISLDSMRRGGNLIGATGIGLDIQKKNIIGQILVNDRNGIPFYQLGAEVVKRNEKIILTTSDPQWVLNSNKWTISSGEILTIENPTSDLVADIHLQHDQMKLDLYGRKSENLHLDIQKVLLSMLVPPELILNKPDGIVTANVTYKETDRKNLDFKFDISQIKWSDLMVRRLALTGNLIADSSGIKETSITAQLNDSATVTLDFGQKTGINGPLLHSTFSDIPVHIAEPLIRKYANQLHGFTSGDITFSKEKNKLNLDGEISLKEAGLRIVPLNARFSFPEERIIIKNNIVNFDQFIVRDSMLKQLYVNGIINMNDSKNIITDLRITSDNLQVMNTSMKDNPVFFGSLIMKSGLDIKGAISNPSVTGTLALESGTNITYRYKGDQTVSELQKVITFGQLNGNQLVINDISPQKKEFSKMPSIQTSIEINPKSVFNFEISSSFDVGVKISGSGLLNYAMLPNNTMSLSGSYEIQQGTSELKMVGWPRKYFIIVPGSSVRWNGKIDDPEINLEATSRVRSSYENPIDNKNRDVDFFVSMKISGQLSQVSVVFDAKSPDQYITSVLATLSPEERMIQAVNLLLFEGIDLPDIKSTNSYLTSQINGFWESQLNSMTKSNVKKVNLSFGIDSYTETSSGGEQDYKSLTYEVEKKMLHNRGSVKVSGRVNDVKQPGQTSNNMIENFSFEYALDTLNSKFLNLYRKQDYEDILEGQVIKSGVGFIYRKNYDAVREIWQRKKKNSVSEKQGSQGKQ